MKFTKIILSLALFVVLFAGSAFAEDFSIVCTSFPCYDFARAVCGGDDNIRMLIKPGAEVHAYEPTPADILALSECDLFIYIGGESDAWVEDILASFGDDAPRTLRLFECADAVEAAHEEGHDHHHDDHHPELEYDEHIWTSPVNAVTMLEAISAEICTLNGANAEIYAANTRAYIDEIQKIDAEIRAIVDHSARKELIFADRFPFIYLTSEYGLEYVSAFPSCSAESEPSAKTMMMLIERVISDGVPAVYTIELSTGKTAQTIAEETGAEILTLHSVQTVSEADFTAGESYVSLMKNNVEALRRGLN